MNTLDGSVVSSFERRHARVEWLIFLCQINRETLQDKSLHLICDNYATHKHPKANGRRVSCGNCLLFSSTQTTGSRRRNGRAYKASSSYMRCRNCAVRMPMHHINMRHGLRQSFPLAAGGWSPG